MTAATEWCIQYENTSPGRERNRSGLVMPLGNSRYQHEIRAHSLSELNAYRGIAEHMGATGMRVAAREVMRTFGAWRELDTEAVTAGGRAVGVEG